jgi:hypothetical protein
MESRVKNQKAVNMLLGRSSLRFARDFSKSSATFSEQYPMLKYDLLET